MLWYECKTPRENTACSNHCNRFGYYCASLPERSEHTANRIVAFQSSIFQNANGIYVREIPLFDLGVEFPKRIVKIKVSLHPICLKMKSGKMNRIVEIDFHFSPFVL